MSKGWTPSCPVLIWSCVTAVIEGHVGRGDSVSKESESVKGVIKFTVNINHLWINARYLG